MGLIRAIAGQGCGGYRAPVAAILLRLLAIAALVLMPISMGMGPASAAPRHSTAMSGMAEGHCGEQQGGKPDKAQVGMHCSAACTALLGGLACPSLALPVPSVPAAMRSVDDFAGTSEPPATPPPRLG